MQKSKLEKNGFTLIEIIIVVVILSIAALLAIPMLGNSGDIQVRAAGDMIAADLEYAKGMAVSRQKPYTVVFSDSAESYSIKDANGTVIKHPVNGKPYSVNFTTDSRISQVNISSLVDFGGTSQVEFDSVGKPVNGGGKIFLAGGGKTVTVSVDAVTGYISVSN